MFKILHAQQKLFVNKKYVFLYQNLKKLIKNVKILLKNQFFMYFLFKYQDYFVLLSKFKLTN